jgi:hypothetical protein
MNEVPVTQPYLESLSTDELLRMADHYGLDIPPDLDRIFIIEELLDFAAENKGEGEDSLEDAPAAADFLESAALPKQYNITFIEAMIRDPLWVFVFWEVKSADREVFENAEDFDGYYLKVSPWGREEPAVREKISPEDALREGVFFVPVGADDTAWYLGFPPAGETGAKGDKRYKVELCAGRRGEEILLAVSGPVKLPDLPESPGWKKNQEGVYGNPLVCLSGAGDFRIIRNGDRRSRIKKREQFSAG